MTPEADRALTCRYYLAVWEPHHSYLPWDLGGACGCLAEPRSLCLIFPQLLSPGLNRTAEISLKVQTVTGLFLPAVGGSLVATLDSLRNPPNLFGTLNQYNPKFVASTLKIISGLSIL